MFGKKSQDEKIGVPPMPGRAAAQAPADMPQTGPSPYPAAPSRPSAAPQQGAGAPRVEASDANAKKLIVGRDIVLSGELRRCDTLIIEGEVEAVLKDGRELVIAETGLFRGTITVDQARIEGRLEGTVTVRRRLSLRATGRIEGTVRYGEIEIEQGGVLTGTAERMPEEKVAPERTTSEPAESPDPATAPAATSTAGTTQPTASKGGPAPTLPGLPAS